MHFEKYPPFMRMILGALLGASLGIVFGLFFGYIIGFISLKLMDPAMAKNADIFPFTFASFLGMGSGAIIGSLLGAIYANKK